MSDYLHVDQMDGVVPSEPPIEEWPQSVWAMEAAAASAAAAVTAVTTDFAVAAAPAPTPETAPEPPVTQSTPVAAPPAEQEQ